MAMETTRRAALLAAVSAGALAGCGTLGISPAPGRGEGEISPSGLDWTHLKWRRGIENQRRADLGDGAFLNPILSGDHPDPTIIRDGDVWYMTFSSFESYPGLVIWTSRDLVNWAPVTAALRTNIGSVWAPELVKHGGRFYLYIPARFPDRRSIYVIHAERIEGPWSEPIDLDLPKHIDPGHAVGEDGKRYLFLSGGDRVALRRGLVMHRVATQRNAAAPADFGRRMQIRVVNDRHIVTMYSRTPGRDWTQYGVRIEVSGYNHNTAWDFLSLRPAIYCTGQGEARIRSVTYRAL
jgi:beta-xylosidase